jgi:hypothetical protein
MKWSLSGLYNPAKLAAFSIKDGALLASADVCGDADDLFFDPVGVTFGFPLLANRRCSGR